MIASPLIAFAALARQSIQLTALSTSDSETFTIYQRDPSLAMGVKFGRLGNSLGGIWYVSATMQRNEAGFERTLIKFEAEFKGLLC